MLVWFKKQPNNSGITSTTWTYFKNYFNEKNLEELASLRMVKDHFEKIVLTTDVLFSGTSEDGIRIVNIIDWLKE